MKSSQTVFPGTLLQILERSILSTPWILPIMTAQTQAFLVLPVKQTIGVITQEGDQLKLVYDQYQGDLTPYNPADYSTTTAHLYGVLSVGGAINTPFSEIVSDNNILNIASAFDLLDPTTSAMYSALSVLNTQSASSVEQTFNQIDPSIYNAVIFAEELVAHQTENVITNYLWQYRFKCDCEQINCQPLHVWMSPFAARIHQDGSSHLSAKSGYRNNLDGCVFGVDSFISDNTIFGGGLSYAYSDVCWKAIDAKANMNSYGAFLYGAYVGNPWWFEASFGYFYNRNIGSKHLYSASPLYSSCAN